ncbi:MAG: rhamnulokinase family protein [Eubacteriales bacterium]|nr:rhamnulokinase family protein [Eubacteriales bacterium]
MKTYLAYDLGASSGRLMAVTLDNDKKLHLEELYRFDNHPIEIDGHTCWDLDKIENALCEGLKIACERGLNIVSIGVDTWGVDFVLINEAGEPASPAVTYRDPRTQAMREICESDLSFEEHYRRTGIAYNCYNTVYQLLALRESNPELLESAKQLLFIPDYFAYRMSGVPHNEYSIASTSALLDAKTRDWDYELIQKLKLPKHLFKPLKQAGYISGPLQGKFREALGSDALVVLAPGHDTASAFLSVADPDADSVYMSSGTWSLLGLVREDPIIDGTNVDYRFTNEGCFDGQIRYIRNIMGLWMIQSIRREMQGISYVKNQAQSQPQKKISFPEIIALARSAQHFSSLIDVNDERFLAPESMRNEVRQACIDSGQTAPENDAEILACVYHSLAHCYAQTIEALEQSKHLKFKHLRIFGGGCQDTYLNQLSANASYHRVIAGPVEASSLGNALCQMLSDGSFKNLHDAQTAVEVSFPLHSFEVMN